MTTDPPKVTSRIRKEDYGNRCLEITVRGATNYELSFSIGHFPKEKDDWLQKVLTRQVKELVRLTHKNAQKKLQKELRKLLGVHDD